MKIDKRKPVHWLLLLGFFIQCEVGAVLRGIRRRPRKPKTIVLYGHKLNGNLLALHDYMLSHPEDGFCPVFLTMDRSYRNELAAGGVRACWASGPAAAGLLGRAAALISDHGLHSLQPWCGLYQRLGLRLFDVWHGIPFKGFDPDDFRVQHGYDEIWVASNLIRELYTSKFGFPPERVVATGYARTDRLVRTSQDEKAAARASQELPETGKLILFAPTWKQDAAGRTLFPFGCDGRVFVAQLAAIAARYDAAIVLRSHLNSADVEFGAYSNVYTTPSWRYPDAEATLLACDVLICDWSSIAFDFLLLDRPVIFLDVEPPFRKGFSLGPEYRYGSVVGSMGALSNALEQVLGQPDAYWKVHADNYRMIRQVVYGGFDDGLASNRCVKRLVQAITSEFSQ